MLVLTRQRHQSVMIGPDVKVEVVEIQRDKVRLGFHAPKSIEIRREEIARENRLAAQFANKGSHLMDPFLRAAIDEAKLGLSEGGLPIGSVLVRGNQIVARGHNRRVQHGDPMAHAEINCLTQAGRQRTYRDTVLYSTLMPCFLCSGAVVQFGIPKVIVGESITFPGGEGPGGRSPNFLRSHGVEVIDLADPECIQMMSTFIREHPELWNEDIGR
jgi:cytosine deaminase